MNRCGLRCVNFTDGYDGDKQDCTAYGNQFDDKNEKSAIFHVIFPAPFFIINYIIHFPKEKSISAGKTREESRKVWNKIVKKI